VVSEGAAAFAWGGSLYDVCALSYFVVRTLLQFVHAVSSVESAADLLVSLHKALELTIKVSVLAV